jgi:hypothetical protein
VIQDRYQELMRVSRQWRDLKYRKWHGFGHETTKRVADGALALFCPTCPQPGINIPDDWVDDNNTWLYTRTTTLDGNFEMNKLKSKNPGDDVSLSDGTAFLVGHTRYRAHLQMAKEIKEKSTCNQHRAVKEADLNHKSLESTGIGASACARHGCWVPHSVVDFQKGER